MTDVYGYDQPGDGRFNAPVQGGPPQTHVISMTTVEAPVSWSWCHVVTSIFGFFCCQPFGLISVVMSLLAYSDHKVKDYGRSRSKKHMALGFGIAAIVIGCIITIACIAIIASAGAIVANSVNTYSSSSGYSSNDYGYNGK